jgi:outer membrane protein OmpA-like peptidoglycan-associated protein/flagellar hook assembly protein FlgD
MTNKSIARVIMLAAMVALGSSCKSTDGARPPSSPERSRISTEAEGFSPGSTTGHATIDFSLSFGSPLMVKSWMVEMISVNGPVKIFSGLGSSLPSSIAWDGNDDTGQAAAEGIYGSLLSVFYDSPARSSTAMSEAFSLVSTPPAGTISVEPSAIVPTGDGFLYPAKITVNATSALAQIDSWTLDILNPDGKVIRSFADKWPKNAAIWDGLTNGGEQAAAVTNYGVAAAVRDQYGNVGEIRTIVKVGDFPAFDGSTTIATLRNGFSPNGASRVKAMDFKLTVGQRKGLKAWTVVIAGIQAGPQKTVSGTAKNIPDALSWDGKSRSGENAPEGRYAASLTLDYGKDRSPITVKSAVFTLALTPPSGTVVSSPPRMIRNDGGEIVPITFTIIATSNFAPLESWSLGVAGEDGAAIFSANGRYPQASYTWNGKSMDGKAIDLAEKHLLSAKVTDAFGNVGSLSGALGASEIPAVTAKVGVTPKSGGFSPNGDGTMDAMELALVYGQPRAVKAWKVQILKAGETAQIFMDGPATLPTSIFWDGRKADGSKAEEGVYSANLTIDYGDVFKASDVMSAPFILDRSPPTGKITLSQPLFSPLESDPTITIRIDAASKAAKMDSWSMQIYDPNGSLFESFEGKWPVDSVVWDGVGLDGVMVESAEDYSVSAKVRDEFGNRATFASLIPVDVLVEKTADGYRILSSRIFFMAYTADFSGVPAELAASNISRLDRLAEKLDKFPDYQITAVGHTVMINWNDAAKGKAEQKSVLLPLSMDRADAVKRALVERGIDPSRIATRGVGAADQLVPDSDLLNRWRNRRVAFFLTKP